MEKYIVAIATDSKTKLGNLIAYAVSNGMEYDVKQEIKQTPPKFEVQQAPVMTTASNPKTNIKRYRNPDCTGDDWLAYLLTLRQPHAIVEKYFLKGGWAQSTFGAALSRLEGLWTFNRVYDVDYNLFSDEISERVGRVKKAKSLQHIVVELEHLKRQIA